MKPDRPFKIQSGVDSARADDTRSLRDKVIDWITPKDKTLDPPLDRNDKSKRGFKHEVTGRLLCSTELDWDDPEYDFLSPLCHLQPA